MRKRIIICVMIILASLLLGGPDKPFGPDPRIGQTYGYSVIGVWNGQQVKYLHEAVDIHMNCGDSIFAIDAGIASRNWSGNTEAGANDEEVHIGGIIYGHIDSLTIPKAVKRAASRGLIVPAGTFIGMASCGAPNSNWSPHIHLVFGNANYASRNPLGILDSVYGLGCDYFTEDITGSFAGLTVDDYDTIGDANWTLGSPPRVKGGIRIKALSEFSTTLGAGREIAPYQIKWGYEDVELGSFTYNGLIPRKDWQAREKKYNQVHTEGRILDLTKMSGSAGQQSDFSSLANGYWNTLQGVTGNWNDVVDSCAPQDTRKFPDGLHKIWIWATTYCGTVVTDTVEVFIDNNPPQAEVEKVGDYAIKVTFSEPMDTTTFPGNISIKAFCKFMEVVNIDSMSFSEDLTELTIFVPDTFAPNEAYYIKLASGITDIPGSYLDGDGDCFSDGSEDFDTIIGTGCIYNFIAQSGGSTDGWVQSEDYQDCLDSHPDRPYWYCGTFNAFGGPNSASLRSEYPQTHATVSATGEGVVWPPNIGYTVSLVQAPPDGYTFNVNKNGMYFTWGLIIDRADLTHYSTYVRLEPQYGANCVTTVISVGNRYVNRYRYNFTCNSALSVIDTLVGEYNTSQRDAIYEFHSGMSCYSSGATGIKPSYTELDDNPIITGLGLARVYSGFTGPSKIQLLKSGGLYPYDGGCGSGAPYGHYTIADAHFEITNIPDVRDPCMNYEVNYGDYHEQALALGMPVSVVIGEGGGYGRPTPDDSGGDEKKDYILPKEYSLGKPRPNPFNTAVSFDIDLPVVSIVDVRIYDIMGRLVDVPIERMEIPPGRFTETWRCDNCPSGTYFIMLQANEYRKTRKVTMVK